jgi:mono/diheme cytochrome c family protein
MKRVLLTAAATILVLVLGTGLFVASGLYDVGADRPHTRWTFAMLDTLRERSVARRASNIQVPPLNSAERLAEGAEHYSAMCTECHLAPGMPDTPLRQGLMPKPPELSRSKVDPAEAFWVIKHGIKATAMPAWGKTHDDEEIWNLVAFVEQLPMMSPEQYRAATRAASSEDGSMPEEEDGLPQGHHHEHEHEHAPAHADAPRDH